MKLSRINGPLKGELNVPGDKSISHRSIMLGAIAEGVTEIRGFLKSADCIHTIGCFKAMGVDIEEEEDVIRVKGAGLRGLAAPSSPLDCGNSGTTMRLISGILSGQAFPTRLIGDSSLSRRPMKRIISPLTAMGALISSENGSGCAPLSIKPSELKGADIHIPIASAQVKSAVLLSALYAEGETVLTEPVLSRNHTELMLSSFGADISPGSLDSPTVSLRPGNMLKAQSITVPGDISSAAYFLGAALMVPESEVLLKNVGINPTRDGIIRVLKAMGADLTFLNEKTAAGERRADILVRYSELKGTEIGGSLIPSLIDEIPLIAVIATRAEGDTVIRDAAELKVKESDRIKLTTENLRRMGADVEATSDGMVIHGPTPLHHAVIETAKDHRIAMSFSIAALASSDARQTEIKDAACVSISYPGFFGDLDSLKDSPLSPHILVHRQEP
ncbi:MAG: 3-phosphoshikimate 1-carboxyvinyltransferase [Lachnospiraceae bacterium]|nr:3-phosphoshikimate 1-carboxyvinyltransferase [Lachnospiraceae bacterium]